MIDDGNFVDQALQILKSPLEPYSFAVHFDRPFDFFYYFANPPGLAYFLACAISAFGHSELALHGACLVFSGTAVVATHAFAQRQSGRGLFAALLLLATPAFAVSSHSLMADVPAAALYTVAIHAFLRGMDDRDLAPIVLAGVAAGLAALLKYSGLSVIGLMALYTMLRLRRDGDATSIRLAATAIALAAGIFAAWCLASQMIYGEIHFLAAGALEARPQSAAAQLQQALAALADLGGATIFAPILLVWSISACAAIHRAAGAAACLLSLIVGALPLLQIPALQVWDLSAAGYSLANRLLLALLLASGTAAVGFALAAAGPAVRVLLGPSRGEANGVDREAAVTLVLVAWLLGFVLLDARLLFATPKYLVPALVPLILLLLRAHPPAFSRSKGFVATTLATTLATALALAVASANHGGSQRRMVQQAVPEIAGERPIWFTGHHAIRYYAEKAGQRSLPDRLGPRANPAPGDVVYVVRGASKHAVPELLKPRLEEIARVEAFAPLPLVINNLRLGAGYWAHGAVPLPYAFSSEPHSTLLVFRVRARED